MGHQKALHHAEGQTDAQSNEDHGEDIAPLPLQVHRTGHAHQAGDSAHADVDAAGNHDHAHAAGENDEGGVVVQNVEEVLRLGEAAAQEKHGGQVQDKNHHNGDREQQIGVAHGGPFLQPPLFVNCGPIRHVRPPPLPPWRALSSCRPASPAPPER